MASEANLDKASEGIRYLKNNILVGKKRREREREIKKRIRKESILAFFPPSLKFRKELTTSNSLKKQCEFRPTYLQSEYQYYAQWVGVVQQICVLVSNLPDPRAHNSAAGGL